jgi:uncharacterized membrane protein YadS
MSDRAWFSTVGASVNLAEAPKVWVRWSASLLLVFLLTVATQWLSTALARWNPPLQAIAFPVYAVAVGLLAGGILSLLGIRDRLAAHLRTEFLLKTGHVLLGASINLQEFAVSAPRAWCRR